MEAMQFHTACNRNSKAMRWDEITTQLLASCRSLLEQKGEWPPAELPNKSVEQMHLAALTAEMTQLKSKMSALTSSNSSEIKCHDCGKKGFKKGHDGCPSPGTNIHRSEGRNECHPDSKFPPTPKEGDPHEINFKDVDWVCCKKCRGGWWHKKESEKAHTTENHRTGGVAALCMTQLNAPALIPAPPDVSVIASDSVHGKRAVTFAEDAEALETSHAILNECGNGFGMMMLQMPALLPRQGDDSESESDRDDDESTTLSHNDADDYDDIAQAMPALLPHQILSEDRRDATSGVVLSRWTA